ncbi:membrane-spanning 4-domains subfamily A member 4A-like isoform X1 [Rhinoderma darwinii]|uniref:membrane-spanning 4-domains subfamily A member 4A-like isoform X1 n=1 Tax=Rhinoderma darwinii TaxID=43563 RepID=UPI003F66846A
MSPVVPEAGGFVVISQIRPQNEQENGPEEEHSCNAQANLPKPLVAFYRGEPEVLGTTLLFSGIILLSIGIFMAGAIDYRMNYVGIVLISSIPIWSGILYIISGSLSVAASVKPTVGKVKSSLVMNIFCSLTAACGIILAVIDVCLIAVPYYPYFLRRTYCACYKSNTECLGAFSPIAIYIGLILFILILFMLMFCITISTSVFACRTVCRSSFQELNVVIYQTTHLNISDTTRDVPPDSTIALTSDLKTQT